MSTLTMGRLRRFGIATLTTGLMMSAAAPDRADASVIRPKVEQQFVYYSTTGTIGGASESPAEFLDFAGVSNSTPTPSPAGVFYMPGVFSLGGFKAMALPDGESRAVEALPFSITISLFGDPFAGAELLSQIRIDGTLDGELSSEPGNGLLASVSSIAQVGTPLGVPPFRVEDLQLLAPQFILPAGQLPSTTTPLYGYVDAQVPEPTALATLGLGVVALAWTRRRRRANPTPREVTA